MGELFGQGAQIQKLVSNLFSKNSLRELGLFLHPDAPPHVFGLPLERIVGTIVGRAKSLLEELPTQTPQSIVRKETLYKNCFDVQQFLTGKMHKLFCAEETYSAACSLLDKRIVENSEEENIPPIEHVIYSHAAVALISHNRCCTEKYRNFMLSAHQKNHLFGLKVGTYLQLEKEQEAIDAFIENYVKSEGKGYLVIDGEAHLVVHDSDAWDIRKKYPRHNFEKDLEKIPDSPAKKGLQELLLMPFEELTHLPIKEIKKILDKYVTHPENN